MGFHKALYGLYLKMVVEMETSCWSGSVKTPTTGKTQTASPPLADRSDASYKLFVNINLCRMPRARLQWKSSAAS